MRFAIIGQVLIDEIQTQKADRNVYEENKTPMKVSDNQTAHEGAKHRTDQTGNGDEGHGANQLVFGKTTHHGQPAAGDHHGSAATLKNAEGHQEMDVARDAAENRSQGEDADGGGKDAAGSKAEIGR